MKKILVFLFALPFVFLLSACAPLASVGNRIVGSVGVPPLFAEPAPDALELSIPYGRGAREICLKKSERIFANLPAYGVIRKAALEQNRELPNDDAPAAIVRLFPAEGGDAGFVVGSRMVVGFKSSTFKSFLVVGEPQLLDGKLYSKPSFAGVANEVDLTLNVQAPVELWLVGSLEGCGTLEVRRGP